jgi:hypothetical protein
LSSEIAVIVNPAVSQVAVQPEVAMVFVSAPGPPGPTGPTGPAGAPGGALFVYDRLGVPASQWIVMHNLGRLVHVTVMLDSGEELTADVTQADLNNLTISFAVPTSGRALIG